MSATRGAKANIKQKEQLVEFLKKHPILQSGKFSPTFTYKDGQKLWQEAATKLNDIPGGGCKTWEQWRKTWQDLESRTKKETSEIKKRRNITGGGSMLEIPTYQKDEEAVLELISKVSTEGHDAPETEIDFIFEEDDPLRIINDDIQEEDTIDLENCINVEGSARTSNKQETNQNCDNNTKRKSSTRALEVTMDHARYLGSIQKNYYEEKIKFQNEILNLKKRKIVALERTASANEKIAAALEIIATNLNN